MNQAISNRFPVKEMGELKYFLGVAVDQKTNPDCIWIGQPAYKQRVLDKFGMDQAKPVSMLVLSC